MRAKTILDQDQLELTINRLCYQLVENHDDFKKSVIIGMQPRGAYLAEIIHKRLQKITGNSEIPFGVLDASFYRDDFRRREKPIQVSGTDISFDIENENVILVDDVLFTGRMLRAALDALMDFGRPNTVEFLALIERRYQKQLPVDANYVGKVIDSVDSERVEVIWKENKGKVVLNKTVTNE